MFYEVIFTTIILVAVIPKTFTKWFLQGDLRKINFHHKNFCIHGKGSRILDPRNKKQSLGGFIFPMPNRAFILIILFGLNKSKITHIVKLAAKTKQSHLCECQ